MTVQRRLAAITVLWLTWALRLNRLFVLGAQADEGVHVTVAERVAQGNAAIYSDLFENRTPGVEWLLSALFRLAGAELNLARLLAVGMACLTVAALYTMVKVMAGRARGSSDAGVAGGVLAGTLLATAPLAVLWGRFTMLEHFTAAASAVSITLALLALRSESGPSWLASGLAAAVAVVFKQSALLLVPVFGSFFVLRAFSQEHRRIWRQAALWSVGFVLPLGLVTTFLLAQGSLGNFLNFLSGAGQLAPLANWREKASVAWAWSLRRPAVPLALVGALAVLWQRRASGALLLLLWCLAEVGALFLPPQLDLQPGGFSHYAIPALASGAALAALGPVLFWPSAGAQDNCRQLLLPAVVLGAALLTAPGWVRDVGNAWLRTEYPQPDREQEQAIGRAASLVADPSQPIVVLANAIFYHWAGREPATGFFHWPEYLGASALAGDAGSDVALALSDPDTGAVLISRIHMEERITPEVNSALWRRWIPAALLPYPYQRDVVLFLPRPKPATGSRPLAEFDTQFALREVHATRLDTENVLVRLHWQRLAPATRNYTVFVHLLGEAGALLGQADSAPVVGFRPTTSWQKGEVVVDYHWLRLPTDVKPGELRLSVGLYNPGTGERLLRHGPAGAAAGAVNSNEYPDSWDQPLDILLE